jgi:hypothetical protein
MTVTHAPECLHHLEGYVTLRPHYGRCSILAERDQPEVGPPENRRCSPAAPVAAPLPGDAAPPDDQDFLLLRLGLLRDDAANGFEALFIIAGRLFNIFGEYPQHRGLELNEWLRHVESHGSSGGHAALLLAGHTAGV